MEYSPYQLVIAGFLNHQQCVSFPTAHMPTFLPFPPGASAPPPTVGYSGGGGGGGYSYGGGAWDESHGVGPHLLT